MNQLIEIYHILFQYYGPQHWWPSDTVDETVMGAILTQNVVWSNVEKALTNLKTAGIVKLTNILKIDGAVLADLILPARFSRQKSVYLKEIAGFFQRYEFDYKKLRSNPMSEIRHEILKVKGIGNETADTILLYALEMPSFVIDAYTKRIFSRVGIAESDKISYHALQQLFHQFLNQDYQLFNEYHALIVRLAKDYCQKRNPECKNCPLTRVCNKKNLEFIKKL